MEVHFAQLAIQIVIIKNEHQVKGELLGIDVFELSCLVASFRSPMVQSFPSITGKICWEGF